MAKIDTILSYIHQCEDVIIRNDNQQARKLRNTIISVYNQDIKNIAQGTESEYICGYRNFDFSGDYINSIEVLKAKLINLFDDIEMKEKQDERELEKSKSKQSNLNINNTNQNNNYNTSNATTNITITLEQTIEQIQNITDEKLSDEDKNKLVEYVYDLEKFKNTNKNKFWDKSKDVLKFIADKGADAAIAALPLIVQGLSNL